MKHQNEFIVGSGFKPMLDCLEVSPLLCLYTAQSCGVATLAEGVAVPLDAMPSAGEGSNLEFGHGASDSSPTLCKGHHGIFNVHHRMLAQLNVHPRNSTHIDESPCL